MRTVHIIGTALILAIGRNYAAHAAELNNAIPSEPFFFLKPTSSYVPDNTPVENPRGVTLHHEVELGVVIGTPGRDISEDAAEGHIAGYFLAIDYTARNMQAKAKSKGLPWSAAKGFDTFCPVSGFIPKAEITDVNDLTLTYAANGDTRQNGSTALMLYKLPRLIAHCSSIMKLETGDVILTGTPEGVSVVSPGDKIHAELVQGHKVLATLDHEIMAREKGYVFEA